MEGSKIFFWISVGILVLEVMLYIFLNIINEDIYLLVAVLFFIIMYSYNVFFKDPTN